MAPREPMRGAATAFLFFVLGCSGAYAQQQQDLTADAVATLKSGIENFDLRIMVFPTATQPGLRGVMLYVPRMLIEPSARLKIGGDIWANAQIPAESATAIVDLAADAGLFKQAAKYYSDRTPPGAGTPAPPAFAAAATTRPPNPTYTSPAIHFSFTSFDEYWYSIYEATLPWDARMQELLQGIHRALDSEDGVALDKLLALMRDPSDLPVNYIGSFTTLRNTGEHAYLDELRLWQHDEALYGIVLRQAGLIGDTPIQLDRVAIGGMDASGELLAIGAALGFNGKLTGDRIDGETSDGQMLVLERGSNLAFLVPEIQATTVRDIDAWIDELTASGRFVTAPERQQIGSP